MMFVSLDLNRKNINRAISDNMLKDLGKFDRWGTSLYTNKSQA